MPRQELALLVVLMPLWLAAFGLTLREAARGGPPQSNLVVGAPAGPDAYPQVARLRPGVEVAGGVRAGDFLIRVADKELRGAMPWVVYAHLNAAASPDWRVEVAYERQGVPGVSSEHLLEESNIWREAAIALSFAGTAVLLLLRAPHLRMVQTFGLATLVWTFTFLMFQGRSVEQTYAYFAVRAVMGTLWAPLMIRAAFHFPEGSWPRDARLPWWPWLFGILGLTWTSKWSGLPFPVDFGTRANPAIGSLVIAAILVIATRNYQRAGALGRRQVRWVLLGSWVGMAPVLLGNLAAILRPEMAEFWYASQVALVAIPISIFIGVTRSNLLDVDRLISGTASYTILLVLLGVSALTLVPWMAEQASSRAGVDPTLVQVLVAMLLAVCVVRVEPILRPWLERAFFAERHALQDGIGQLVSELAGSPDARTLTRLVGERLDDLLRPASCVIYARGEDSFAPVFSRGSTVTPHFGLDSPLLGTLAEKPSAVDLERGRALFECGNAEDRAALGSLEAAVLVPVARGRDLAALVVLGRKGSGDIYTPTDVALLGVVGATLSASLTQFGGEELLREAHSLQDRLRQYVPASIATQLIEGRNLEASERSVSVLFADLRGYTSLAEGRRAEEIFSTVSRYTETVTRVVSGRGGTVVEFNGDGMMAVFGAPEALPDKELSALRAAREIVEGVSALGGMGGERLEVGVGIATGAAYVGAIRSVDRYIWSAIGNTTNLAARLQSLTKDLGAPIVIDAATRIAVGDAVGHFDLHPDTVIRGLREPRDLFSIPRSRLVPA